MVRRFRSAEVTGPKTLSWSTARSLLLQDEQYEFIAQRIWLAVSTTGT